MARKKSTAAQSASVQATPNVITRAAARRMTTGQNAAPTTVPPPVPALPPAATAAPQRPQRPEHAPETSANSDPPPNPNPTGGKRKRPTEDAGVANLPPNQRAKIKKYLDYGEALIESDVYRQKFRQRFNGLAAELQDHIFRGLVWNYLPRAMHFPERCPEDVGKGLKTIRFPEYFERGTTVDTVVKFMFQAMSDVKLVTPDLQRQHGIRFPLHPGFEVDDDYAYTANAGSKSLAQRLGEAIAETVTIIHHGGLTNDQTQLPLPVSLYPNATHVKSLCLHITFPFKSTETYPAALYQTITQAPNIRQRLTSLEYLRINILEQGPRPSGATVQRGGYSERSYRRENTVPLAAIFGDLIKSLRKLGKTTHCSIFYRNDDQQTHEFDCMQLRAAADEVPQVDRTKEKDAVKIGQEIYDNPGFEYLVSKPEENNRRQE